MVSDMLWMWHVSFAARKNKDIKRTKFRYDKEEGEKEEEKEERRQENDKRERKIFFFFFLKNDSFLKQESANFFLKVQQ